MQDIGIGRKPFDGRDAGAVSLDREHRTRFDGLTVQMDRAATALAGVATDVGSGKTERIAQRISKQRPVFNGHGLGFTVNGKFDFTHCLPRFVQLPAMPSPSRDGPGIRPAHAYRH